MEVLTSVKGCRATTASKAMPNALIGEDGRRGQGRRAVGETLRRRTLCAVACYALFFPSVRASGQSQTDDSPKLLPDRTSEVVLRNYAGPKDPAVCELPANLSAAPYYRTTLDAMRRLSPIFRRQCMRLAQRPDIRVEIEAGRPSSAARARTAFVIEKGQLVARVHIFTFTYATELIAHELEHVIEKLDGVNHQARAALNDGGVRVVEGDLRRFETTRAVRVGIAVAREVRLASQ
jgi:hypothetical protein